MVIYLTNNILDISLCPKKNILWEPVFARNDMTIVILSETQCSRRISDLACWVEENVALFLWLQEESVNVILSVVQRSRRISGYVCWAN